MHPVEKLYISFSTPTVGEHCPAHVEYEKYHRTNLFSPANGCRPPGVEVGFCPRWCLKVCQPKASSSRKQDIVVEANAVQRNSAEERSMLPHLPAEMNGEKHGLHARRSGRAVYPCAARWFVVSARFPLQTNGSSIEVIICIGSIQLADIAGS